MAPSSHYNKRNLTIYVGFKGELKIFNVKKYDLKKSTTTTPPHPPKKKEKEKAISSGLLTICKLEGKQTLL